MSDPLQLARECGMCVRSVSNHEPRWWSIEANQHSLATLIDRVRAEAMREQREEWAKTCRRAMLAMKRAYPHVDEAAEAEYAELDDARSELQAMLGRDGEHCMCPACRGGLLHASCCAVHNEPAMPNGPCDCGAIAQQEQEGTK